MTSLFITDGWPFSVALSVPQEKNTRSDWLVRLLSEGGERMLRWALIFLIIALVAALFGFTGIAAAAAGIAKFLFFLFLVVCLIFFVIGISAGRRVQ
jgi:uncharacterized membrane protein YtjA (UPF0391 family)